jgi:hypothetical protein
MIHRHARLRVDAQTEKHMTTILPTPALRWCANLLALWGLCAHPACRRAQACRRDPRGCLSRYAPLVPEDAREGVKAMVSGVERGLDFETLREDDPDAVDAAIGWMDRVARSARKEMPDAPRAKAAARGTRG